MTAQGHIALHRLWSVAHLKTTFNPLEQTHLDKCDECRRLFAICRNADSFGAVLKEVQPDEDSEGKKD